MRTFVISNCLISDDYPPLVIAEIGINYNGEVEKALELVDAAAAAGCECVKFQCHIPDEEMLNDGSLLWTTINNCVLTEEEDRYIKEYVEKKGMIYLSTPFSFAAVDRLERLGVAAYKIGSGEVDNIPLLEYVASKRKPVIISSGMSNMKELAGATLLFGRKEIPYSVLHCVSLYPCPYDKVNLYRIRGLRDLFPDAVIGMSDHTPTIYTSLAAVALGARIIEKHFTIDRTWPGPDQAASITTNELKQLIEGTKAVWEATEKGEQGETIILAAKHSVVAARDIYPGEEFTTVNVAIKRPGNGQIRPRDYDNVLGRIARVKINRGQQLEWGWIS